jgi:hypothetical protein
MGVRGRHWYLLSPKSFRKIGIKKKALCQISIPKIKIISICGTIYASSCPTAVDLNISVQTNITAAPPWKNCGDTHGYTCFALYFVIKQPHITSNIISVSGIHR